MIITPQCGGKVEAIMSLKNRLITYMKDDWQFPMGIDADALADEMKEALASVDGILRDRLVLNGFGKLIESGNVSDEKCRSIFDELISDKYLLKGLGKECDDSVFGRAFSGYAILSFLEYSEGKDEKIFTEADHLQAFHAVLKCFNEEKDLRGFVDGRGWAHSIAHNADCLAEFVSSGKLGHKQHMDLLLSIKRRIFQGHSAVISEYDRILGPVLGILDGGIITEQEFADWLDNICTYEKTESPEENARHIMSRCEFMIFLRYRVEEKHPQLTPFVLDGMIKLMKM